MMASDKPDKSVAWLVLVWCAWPDPAWRRTAKQIANAKQINSSAKYKQTAYGDGDSVDGAAVASVMDGRRRQMQMRRRRRKRW